jgi:hypothetical protein
MISRFDESGTVTESSAPAGARATRRALRVAWGVAGLALIGVGIAGLAGRGVVAPAGAARFVLEPNARRALQALWTQSVDANEERAACLGGESSRDRVRIARVAPVLDGGADSARVLARASLDRCGPPEWMGTVHTHILEVDGRAASELSAPDRAVAQEWRARWRSEGVFCVLYSSTHATCEAGALQSELVYGSGGEAP